MRSNCLLFAIGRWLQARGAITTRRSQVGWWPHFVWTPDFLHYEEFVPLEYDDGLWIPPMYFRGFIKYTTAAEQVAGLVSKPRHLRKIYNL